ncbi:hypothetical protein QBC46DRAFT_461896 [Diplogelasinospora grovesii]|uniref:ATP-grasp domain-containing protein n=1 Tax=Diplogelasinospora grovesii TaxID=303347 RepID=A0AAN6MZC8_9PEZI|nr:hypothetical protein QBC46DRAFT_461896 [Diplogelasinospora grovesii]
MKICVVQTSYEGSNHFAEKFDPLCDPSRYISPDVHQFEHRFVRKASMKEDIDKLCDEEFDIYFSCLWGGPRDNVAGIDAAVYLESKNVPVLTNRADAMRFCNDKHEFYSRVRQHSSPTSPGILLPGNDPGHFPKIVKLSDGANSQSLDFSSICHTQQQLSARIDAVRQGYPDADILVQDYISGAEVNVVVVEMGHNVVALEPVEYIFPDPTPPEEAFLTFENKFMKVGKGSTGIRTKLVTDEPRRSHIRSTAERTFVAAGMQNGSGWCRVDMRVDQDTNDIYVLEINAFPTVFYPKGAYTSDKVVARTYPGGHAALFDMLLATRLIQTGAHKETHRAVATFFDDFSERYEQVWEMPTIVTVRTHMAVSYDWRGTVLDMACGSGFLGHALHDAGYIITAAVTITGVDISPSMASSERARKYYTRPIHIAPMEEFIMTSSEYDHVACFNGFQYLPPVIFTAVLSRMFMLAQKSVSFEVDNMPQEHIDRTNKRVGSPALFNNTPTMARFQTPNGWKRVCEKEQLLFHSPNSGIDVHGVFYRFEREPKEASGDENDFL